MILDCAKIKEMVQGISLVRHCDTIRNGMVRMATPFRYPDGSLVDLFLGQNPSLFEGLKLTDLGQTTAYLLNLHVKPWATQKRKQRVADICNSLAVSREGGELVVYLPNEKASDIAEAMVRLGQACIRMSDLAFTQSLRSVNAFREDLEEFIEFGDVRYEPDILLPGQFGKDVSVDFRVYGKRVTSLVQTVSTGNSAAAHGLANEVFRRWYDLTPQRSANQFVTVYDASNDVFRGDDLARLSDVSQVFAFPAEQDALKLAIAA